jgi:hypothetical protein
MAATYEDAIACKDLLPQKVWVPGYRNGDETAADITLQANTTAGATKIIFGRLSNTASNNTLVQFRDRTGTKGTTFTNGQWVIADNTFSSVPVGSILLDLRSTTGGVVLPRMTTTQKNAISSPAQGLMVFDTTLVKLCVYSGTTWETITSS